MTRKKISIIFHGIGSPGRLLEPGEEPYWIDIKRFENILDRISANPTRYHITFDDGNFSDYSIALPRLLAYELRADFFVLSGRIGLPGSLGLREIQELLAAGMGVGSHGVAHRNWRDLKNAPLRVELEQSKRTLEEICGVDVTQAGIPFGSWNGKVLKALRKAGYKSAWSSDGGWMRPSDFLKPRRSIRADMNEETLRQVLSGQMTVSRKMQRHAGMLLKRLS